MRWCRNMRTRSGVGRGNRLSRLLCVTTELFDGRPTWAHRQCRRCEFLEFIAGIDDLSANDFKYRFEILGRPLGDGKIIARENTPVSQFAWGGSSPFFLL